jgi:hypothetical protein
VNTSWRAYERSTYTVYTYKLWIPPKEHMNGVHIQYIHISCEYLLKSIWTEYIYGCICTPFICSLGGIHSLYVYTVYVLRSYALQEVFTAYMYIPYVCSVNMIFRRYSQLIYIYRMCTPFIWSSGGIHSLYVYTVYVLRSYAL